MSDSLHGAHAALSVPLAHALDCRLLDDSDPAAGVWFVPGHLADNAAGGTHTAAITALVELAGYLAVAPTLGEGEHAVTHASSWQIIGSAPLGRRLEARAVLQRRGRRVAFVGARVTADDDSVVATALLTKSIVGG